MKSKFTLFELAFLFTGAAAVWLPSDAAASGDGEDMNRRYDQNCYLEAHDAYANPAWDYITWAGCNQDEDLPNLLDNGIRSLDLRPWIVKQVTYGCNPQCLYYNPGGDFGYTIGGLENHFDFNSMPGQPVLAHHIDQWGYGLMVASGVGTACDNPHYFEDFTQGLISIQLWLLLHTNEVVTLNIESSVPTNMVSITESSINAAFTGQNPIPGYFILSPNGVAAGMIPRGERPGALRPSPDGWWIPLDGIPTLQELVANNRRVVILPDGRDFDSTTFYDVGVDTEYGSHSIPLDCNGDHNPTWIEPDQDHPYINMENYMLPIFLMQHVGDTPEAAHDDPQCVQPLSVLEAKLQDIEDAYKRLPTHVRLDYAEQNDPKAFVAEVNGLWAAQPLVTPTCTVLGTPSSPDWYNKDVVITNIWASVSDGSSPQAVTANVFQGPSIHLVNSLSSPTPATVKVTFEGKTVVSFAAIGGALNSVSDRRKVEVWLDKTPPTVTNTFNPLPNAYGWNKTSVTVQISASDLTSGVDTNRSKLENQVFNLEGTNHVQAFVWDMAGNQTLFTTNVLIDETPPVITAMPDRAANSNGWYNAPVTIHFTTTDNLSGVLRGPTDSVLQFDGINQKVQAQAQDYAGNSAQTNVTGINIDTRPPDLRIDTPTSSLTYAAISNNLPLGGRAPDQLSGTIQVLWSNDRGGSGIAAGTNNWLIPEVLLQPGNNVITVTAQDAAGNITNKTLTVTYTPPVLTASRTANQIVLSWPATYSNVIPEMTTSLEAGAIWMPLNGATVGGGLFMLTNSLTNSAGFFRLHGQ